MKSFFALILTFIVCGCTPKDPSPRQIAEQNAQHDFKQAVAAVKVCTTGSTYLEFRSKRMALESCYLVNRTYLTNAPHIILFSELNDVMQATDDLWSAPPDWNTRYKYDPALKQTLIANMNVIKAASGLTYDELRAKGYFPNSYVSVGLASISDLCDKLLQ